MPVSIKLPDQESLGTLVIPSTVALIAGAPNPEQGQALIDYLLSQETERDLMQAGYSHIPLHEGLEISDTCLPVTDIRVMEVDFADVYRYFDVVQSELRDVFIR
jgi:iron(III) transport system substrate-binding protein